MPSLAAFAGWLVAEGEPVETATLTDLELIERYVQVGMAGQAEATRATRRSTLRSISARVSPDVPRPEMIAYRRARAPYEAWQVARFLELAAAQPTLARRRSCTALLALGLGCGLDRQDLAWVRGTDVTNGPGGAVTVIVSGGPRPRSVVALGDYAPLIASCAARQGERLLIGGWERGRHNVTTPVLERMVTDQRLPRVVPSRLRSTWLVRHLNLRTPLAVLLPAAGLQSSRTLDDLLRYADAVGDDAAAALLQGCGA